MVMIVMIVMMLNNFTWHTTTTHTHTSQIKGESVGLFGQASVAARGGLRVAKTTTVQAVGLDDAVTDVALSGLPGWLAVSAPGARGPITLRMWAPRGVEVFVRPPLPVPSAVQAN